MATISKRTFASACALASVIAIAFTSDASAARRDDARTVILAKFAAVNRHAIEDIVAAYAEDAELTASDFCAPRRGKADVERTYRRIFAAVPDITAEVLETVAQGDRVAVRLVLHSRAPGRSFDLPLMNFFTVRHGLIVRDDGMFDNRGRACVA